MKWQANYKVPEGNRLVLDYSPMKSIYFELEEISLNQRIHWFTHVDVI